jgi:hypothetical protein
MKAFFQQLTKKSRATEEILNNAQNLDYRKREAHYITLEVF